MEGTNADQDKREQFVMQRMHQVLTLLQEGLQEPFQLYTLEVITRLMRDVPKLDAAPEVAMIESIPNRGKVYYGEDIQMITLMKKRCTELKEKKCSIMQMTDKIAEWLEQYADIVIRTQYDQKWCEQQILVCIRLFRERYLAPASNDLPSESQQPTPSHSQSEAPKEGQVSITVTFDSLCGCAYVYKHTRNQSLKNLIYTNLLPMVDVCITQQESFLECLKQSAQLKHELQEGEPEAATPIPDTSSIATPNPDDDLVNHQEPSPTPGDLIAAQAEEQKCDDAEHNIEDESATKGECESETPATLA